MKRIVLLLGILAITAILGSALAVRFTEDAEFCSSCHIMNAAYQTWYHSAHRETANCNTCHVPKGLVSKPLYKDKSGLIDAYVFFIAGSPEGIHLKKDSEKIVQKNCVSCHATLVRMIGKGNGANCYHCHSYTPHGDVRNLVY